MSGSKRPVWLFVAVVLGLADRRVFGAAAAAERSSRAGRHPAHGRGAGRPAGREADPPSTDKLRSSSGQDAAVPAPANVPAVFGPQLLTSTSGPEDWAMEGNNPSRTRSTDAQLALPLSQQREVKLTADTGDGSPLTIARGTCWSNPNICCGPLICAMARSAGRSRCAESMSRPPLPANMSSFAPNRITKARCWRWISTAGKTLWAFTPKRLSSKSNSYFGGHLTSPVVVDGTVFVGAGKEVYALDAASGAVRWEFAAKEYISSSATAADGRIYISDFDALYAIDQKTGAQLWSYPTTMTFYFAPVIGGQTVLLCQRRTVGRA